VKEFYNEKEKAVISGIKSLLLAKKENSEISGTWNTGSGDYYVFSSTVGELKRIIEEITSESLGYKEILELLRDVGRLTPFSNSGGAKTKIALILLYSTAHVRTIDESFYKNGELLYKETDTVTLSVHEKVLQQVWLKENTQQSDS